MGRWWLLPGLLVGVLVIACGGDSDEPETNEVTYTLPGSGPPRWS